jgi:GT2 family glycosyltransferase
MPLETATGSTAGELLLTVAICTRNRVRLLEKAIRSVVHQAGTLKSRVELLVIDNASSDATPALLDTLALECTCLRVVHEGILGLSIARNTALRVARGQYVVFLDDDATVRPGWLTSYLDFLGTLPSDRVAVVGGPVFAEYEIAPPIWFATEKNQLDLGPFARRVPAHGGAWGCNIGYHRQRALAAGAFDPDLGRKGAGLSAHEETDLNTRLEAQGYEVWWVPGAAINHFFPAERLSVKFEIRNQFGLGESAVIGRFRRVSSPSKRIACALLRLVATPFHCLGNLVVAVVMLPFNPRRVAFSNLRQAIRNLGFGFGILKHGSALIHPPVIRPR